MRGRLHIGHDALGKATYARQGRRLLFLFLGPIDLTNLSHGIGVSRTAVRIPIHHAGFLLQHNFARLLVIESLGDFIKMRQEALQLAPITPGPDSRALGPRTFALGQNTVDLGLQS